MKGTCRNWAAWVALLGTVGAVCGTASGQAGGEKRIVVDGSTTVGPIAKAYEQYFRQSQPDWVITVSESGSGNGAKSLINGTCDVADLSRFMKEEEFRAAVARGVLPVAHIVAFDGIALVVHPSNPVKDLSVEQVRDIYTGRIVNWKEVGGPDRSIVVISRDTNSGTYEAFADLVMDRQKIKAGAEYVGSNGQARARVQSTPGAVAYIGLGFVDRTVKALAVNGVQPSAATVVAGTYPVARPLYMFTNGYPKLGTPLHAFVTLHLSRRGQEIIESLGFVPVTDYPTSSRLVHEEPPHE